MSNSSVLPTSLYEGLLAKLVRILELTQKPEGTATPQAKQALLHATNDFKNSIAQAKDLAAELPGGELRIDEQDEVIEMLTQLRDRKSRQQLEQFSAQTLELSSSSAEMSMEVDSMASTPS
ncbi:uncharacterized protein EV420DRAFT_1279205 [Desarmillaria tabescens]|uniref:Mediator of RNA polymerase II transcription subunit 9 n=1 Tax=Armillaria tabescens TaxID=1929756 RepID=A0AA39JE54_ARMTA|nr:uncharacterized protein EV420DRAFT_1279205 [Desarmillaria tabescens]KAK0440397.1 hypothetical protein EV420DRAFT_1279205 [Desarmillaria tabescens]